MFGQQATYSDIPTIITLIFLEGLLSADNAIVLAVLVQGLPEHQRQKGLRYGLAGAFIFRATVILFASYLMRFWWIEASGAIYLSFLCARHFIGELSKRTRTHSKARKARSLWLTIVIVELTDLAFSIDSILAAVGLVGTRQERMWIIYLSGVLGIVMMRFVAGFFLRLIDRHARLETCAYAIIGWISINLAIQSYAHFVYSASQTNNPVIEHVPSGLFWGVMAVLFAMGFTGKPTAHRSKNDDMQDIASVRESAQDV